MKNLALTITTDKKLEINGYPDAVAVVEIEHEKTHYLKSLSLHKADLSIALTALEYFEQHNEEKNLSEIIWYTAVARYFKCFKKSKSRQKLSYEFLFKNEPDAIPVFKYFEALRDKHLLHDENAYSQCHIGAIINRPDHPYKIGDIVSFTLNMETCDEQHFASFHKLVLFTYNWVLNECESIHYEISRSLEAKPYQSLINMKHLTFTAPSTEDIHKNR